MRTDPSITKVSFSCPHCGALAHQTWFNLYAAEVGENEPPHVPGLEFRDRVLMDADLPEDAKAEVLEWVDRAIRGEVFYEDNSRSKYVRLVTNIHLSQCYSCSAIAVWIAGGVAHPPLKVGIEPNSDLPAEVRADFDEARSILNLSPRGAAALLRLSIQKLCRHLGGTGDNLNADIAALGRNGLDVRVQRALDIVRVIGNDAVHPGQIDLRDDRDTATKLLALINLIAEKMITEPRHVDELYGTLPPSKREQIERRDKER